MTCVILAIETATEACSVALAVGDETRQMLVVEPRGHLANVPGMVERSLADAGVARSAIDAVVVSRGPGSFTGVRIGVGYAQGIALGLGVPLNGLSTLEVLAHGAARRGGVGHTLVVLDARMGEVYWAGFELGPDGLVRLTDDTLSVPAAVTLDGGATWAAIGSGAVVYSGVLAATLTDGLTDPMPDGSPAGSAGSDRGPGGPGIGAWPHGRQRGPGVPQGQRGQSPLSEGLETRDLRETRPPIL